MHGSICFKHARCEQFCLSKHFTGSNNRALEHLLCSVYFKLSVFELGTSTEQFTVSELLSKHTVSSKHVFCVKLRPDADTHCNLVLFFIHFVHVVESLKSRDWFSKHITESQNKCVLKKFDNAYNHIEKS